MKMTDEEMEQRIKEESPIGSSKDRVIAFLDSVNIHGLKPHHGEYNDESPIGTNALEGRQNEVRGYLVAGIPKVGRDPSQFQVYNMNIIFYFGTGERLIAYKIQTLGDW